MRCRVVFFHVDVHDRDVGRPSSANAFRTFVWYLSSGTHNHYEPSERTTPEGSSIPQLRKLSLECPCAVDADFAGYTACGQCAESCS